MSDLVFGKYEIQHRIAIGGMGEVFYAIQRGVSGFERPVILKSLLPDLAQQQDLVNQFLDEARVAATLNHPNVVSIFEVGLWNGTFYLAMEYIRGRNLSQLIRRAIEHQVRIPPQVTARIIREAALGLDHAHTAHDANGSPLNIVHRDISPQNIMLREDGVAKVVDFGIASAANRSTRTATGTLKGKLAYMAPEQILAQPMAPSVDQFALGIVFWEMLCSRRLFKADNDVALIKSVLEAEIAPPETVMSDVPADMSAVVMRMLDRDPARRFASLAEVAEAIEALPAAMATPALSASALMRKLGTDDLKVEVKRTTSKGDNFVISLNQGAGRAAPAASPTVDVDLATREGVTPRAAQLPKSRAPWLVGGGVLAAVALAAAYVAWPAGAAKPEPTPVPKPLEAPVVAVTAVPDAGAPAVAVGEAKLELKVTPPDARLRLDGRPLDDFSKPVKVSPGQVHYLLAEAPGFERVEQEIAPLDAGQSREVVLSLKKRSGKGGKQPPPPPPLVVNTPSAPATPGFLTINTAPWTKVSVDGEPAGSTPLKVKLSPGPHQLTFVNEGESINTVRSITIAPGESQKLQLKLP